MLFLPDDVDKDFGVCDAAGVIKATDLINIWMQLQKISLQSVHFLGEMYYFIPPAQLDDLCQWIYDARDHCYDAGVSVDRLLSMKTDEVEIVMDHHIDSILYLPIGTGWQQEKCESLGLIFLHGNSLQCKDSMRVGISQAAKANYRIREDGNCFFRSIAQILTGSQDDHQEVRLLVTSHMSHNLTITDHARLLDPNETMEIYLMGTKMQSIGEWATDVELSAAASMLSTTIYTFSPNGGTYQWLRHAPFENVGETRESLYLTNIGNHFEPVRRM